MYYAAGSIHLSRKVSQLEKLAFYKLLAFFFFSNLIVEVKKITPLFQFLYHFSTSAAKQSFLHKVFYCNHEKVKYSVGGGRPMMLASRNLNTTPTY